jgi:hypothetical protein
MTQTLREIIERIDEFDEDQTVYLDRSSELTPDTLGIVVWAPEDDSVPQEAKGLKCFLDVWHIKEVVEGKARLKKLSRPTLDETVELLIEYAKTGA